MEALVRAIIVANPLPTSSDSILQKVGKLSELRNWTNSRRGAIDTVVKMTRDIK
jgi:hypothetical protein